MDPWDCRPLAALLTYVRLVLAVERGFVYCPAYACTCESQDGGLIVNCMNLYLSALPKFLSFEGRIKELSLRHNIIKSLPAGGFQNLHIEKLDIRDNAINFIDKDAFRGLEHSLRCLSLQVYAMEGLPTTALVRLSRLRSLTIVGCKEEMLRASLFSKLAWLEELQLIGCRISHIQSGTFGVMPLLSNLVLAKNSLGFQALGEVNLVDKLVSLDLTDNDIQYLSSFAFVKLSKLRQLRLGYNKLKYIENKTFANLEFSLEELDLANNLLQQHHLGSLVGLKVLRGLDLSGNNISHLSGEYLAAMRYLARLQLAYNNIQVLHNHSFHGLKSVHDLDLSGNPLLLIEEGAFSETSALHTLNISNSKLGGSITNQSFNGLSSSLVHLEIKNSSLVSSDIVSLSRLTNLSYLDVSRNRIDYLPLTAMASMEKLKHGNFSDNRISSLETRHGSGGDLWLELLDLSWNHIHFVDKCVLVSLKKLQMIRLEGNPLTCNCSLSWLYRWLQVTQIKHQQDSYRWSCSSPAPLRGVYISDLDFTDLNCSDPQSGVEKICPPLDKQTSTILSTTTAKAGLQGEHAPGQVFVNITRPSPVAAHVTWSVDSSQHIFVFILTVKRHNDSRELQNVTVSNSTTNYTFHVNDSLRQDVCVTAVNHQRLFVTGACLPVPIFEHGGGAGSSETRLNHLIQNSFLPLTFMYISGSLATVFVAACVVVFIRGKRQQPRRIKPLGVAYPAWLDHRTSVTSSTMTHDPHFLNTLFVDNTGTLRSVSDNMAAARSTAGNMGVVQPATDITGAPTTTDIINQNSVCGDLSRPGCQNPDANLPLDSPFTMTSRRESGVDSRGTGQDAHVHGLSEARPRRSDASSDFFFHF